MIRESYVAYFISSNFRVSEKELYYAPVLKLADGADSKSAVERRVGSSPTGRTIGSLQVVG